MGNKKDIVIALPTDYPVPSSKGNPPNDPAYQRTNSSHYHKPQKVLNDNWRKAGPTEQPQLQNIADPAMSKSPHNIQPNPYRARGGRYDSRRNHRAYHEHYNYHHDDRQMQVIDDDDP